MNFNPSLNNYGAFKAQEMQKLKGKEKEAEKTEQGEDKGSAQQVEAPKGEPVKASVLDALAMQNQGLGLVPKVGSVKAQEGPRFDPFDPEQLAQEIMDTMQDIEIKIDRAATLFDIQECIADCHSTQTDIENINLDGSYDYLDQMCADLYSAAMSKESKIVNHMNGGIGQGGNMPNPGEDFMRDYCQQVGYNSSNYDQYGYIYEHQNILENRSFFRSEINKSNGVINTLTQFIAFLQRGTEGSQNLLHDVQELLSIYTTRRSMAENYFNQTYNGMEIISQNATVNKPLDE